MKRIVVYSHVAEPEQIHAGLAERLGDDAPRVMHAGTGVPDEILAGAGAEDRAGITRDHAIETYGRQRDADRSFTRAGTRRATS